MARKKSRYVCGKCGENCKTPKALRDHVSDKHKTRPRGGRGRKPKFEGVCPKGCGRTDFENKFSFAQHRRFCKGPAVTVVPPIASDSAFSGTSLVELMRKKGVSNGGVVERLKAEAAALRDKSDQILKYVEQFEAGAAKFLTK